MIHLIFLSLLTLLPQDKVEALIDRGYDKYAEEDFKGAIADFDKALTLSPDNTEALYLRGVCKSNLGQKVEAIKDLDAAINLDPYYAEAIYEKAYIFLTDQNAQKAITELNKVIQLVPEMAEAYVTRGTARCMLEDKEGANADWEKAKTLGIDYTDLMVCE